MQDKSKGHVNQGLCLSRDSLTLLRHALGSIDLSGQLLKDAGNLSEKERRDYASAIHAVFPRLEKTIKSIMAEQVLFVTKQAETWEQVLFGRGTFNGLHLLLEHFGQAAQEHIENSTKEDKYDKHAPVGEI